MTIFDSIAGFVSHEKLLGLLEGMLSPTQRMLLMEIPQIASDTIDLTKRPMPKFGILKDDARKMIGVTYEFETIEDMQRFYDNELRILKALNVIKKEMMQNGKQDDPSKQQPAA